MGCIMHRVHTSLHGINKICIYVKLALTVVVYYNVLFGDLTVEKQSGAILIKQSMWICCTKQI